MADENAGTEFESGDVIQFIDLVKKPELNGRLGVVKKMLANGRFRIMVDGENDLAIRKANIEKLQENADGPNTNQCPSKLCMKTDGILIWPFSKEVKGCRLPSMNYLPDFDLQHHFKNPFELDTIDSSQWMEFANEFGSMKISELKTAQSTQVYVQKLKKVLKWKDPVRQLCIFHNSRKVCVYFDRKSSGPLNSRLASLCLGMSPEFAPNIKKFEVLKIRGPFLMYDHLQMPLDYHSLNITKCKIYGSGLGGREFRTGTINMHGFKHRVCDFGSELKSCKTSCESCEKYIAEMICRTVMHEQTTIDRISWTDQEIRNVEIKSFKTYQDMIKSGEISPDPIITEQTVKRLTQELERAEEAWESWPKNRKLVITEGSAYVHESAKDIAENKRVLKAVIAYCKSDNIEKI